MCHDRYIPKNIWTHMLYPLLGEPAKTIAIKGSAATDFRAKQMSVETSLTDLHGPQHNRQAFTRGATYEDCVHLYP